MSMKCEFCGVVATLKCGGCRIVFYCNKEHQKMDWRKGHKTNCKSYEVIKLAGIQRHGKLFSGQCDLLISHKTNRAKTPFVLRKENEQLLPLVRIGLNWTAKDMLLTNGTKKCEKQRTLYLRLTSHTLFSIVMFLKPGLAGRKLRKKIVWNEWFISNCEWTVKHVVCLLLQR